jgi:hypothetical protein
MPQLQNQIHLPANRFEISEHALNHSWMVLSPSGNVNARHLADTVLPMILRAAFKIADSA